MLHATLFTLLLVFIGSSSEIQVEAKPISGPRYNAPHPHYNRTRDFQPRAATTTYASPAAASSAYLKQAQDAEAGRNSGWTAVGCYRDSPTRTLNGLFISSGNMSTKVCMNTCFGKGYTYGGVQYGQECWCGNKINSGTWYGSPPDQYIKNGDTYGTIVPYAECQAMPCSGDASTACGSNWRNTIFMLSDPGAASSAIAWSSSVSAASTSASIYSASSASAASASAKAYSTSAAAYSVSAAAFSSSSLSAAQASAVVYSSSSLAASASAYSSLTRAAGAYSTSASQFSASAAAYSSSSASVASASAAIYSASAAQYSQQQSAIAYSASSQAAAQSAAAYSQSASAYSQSSQVAAQSAAAYSTRAAAFSQSQSAAAYSQSAAAYSQSSQAAAASAAAYSQSAAAYSQSSQAAAASAAAYSQSAAAYSQSVSSAQAQASSAAAYSASVKAASDAQYSSASAYSASVQNAQAQASASAYSASVSGAAYSASVQSAQAAASASAYSANVQQAQSSAAAYSASVASASAAAASASAAALEATKLPSTWSMAKTQCIAEGNTGRALTGPSIASPGMSLGQCVKYCNDQGFVLAGIEYSQECYCGNVLEHGSSLNRPSSQCNMKCGGSDDTCGGPNAITLMVSNAALEKLSDDFTSKPITLQDGWTVASTACVAEGTTGRALTGASFADDAMLPAKCMSFCKDKGFRLAGVEFGRECYCGSELSSGASMDKPADNCNVPCAGNPSLIGSCGGGGSLSLFSNPTLGSSQDAASASASQAAAAAQSSSASAFTASLPSGWSVASSSCIEEVGGRALTGASTAGGDMTVPMCISYCSGKGFSMAGLEYGGECYCANALSNGASLDKKSGNCNMRCNGNSDSICGGPSALSLFVGPAAASTSSSTSAAGSVATPTGPQPATNLPSGWSSIGGIAEVPGRALTGYSTSAGNMTIQGCIDICSSRGFSLSAVEYGSECYCDNQFRNGASGDKTSNQCIMPCAGDMGTICGGPDCLSVYTNPNIQPPASAPSAAASPSPSASSASASDSGSTSPSGTSTSGQNQGQDMTGIATNLPSGWSVGPSSCIQEVAGRALVGASTQSSSMTPLQCVQFCSDRGFSMVGLEYGGECYCGNELSNGASFDSRSGECKMPCNGDSSLVCGGPNGINMYINKNASAKSSNTGGIPSGWKAADTTCIQEVPGRALAAYSIVKDDMTIAQCLNICGDKGYSMAGIEYGQECYCDNALQNSASLSKSSNSCTMMCPGNVIDEGKCGGPDAISLFQKI